MAKERLKCTEHGFQDPDTENQKLDRNTQNVLSQITATTMKQETSILMKLQYNTSFCNI